MNKINLQLSKLYKYSDFEKRRATPYQEKYYNLDNIKKLLNHLGNPQNYFKSYHIAGTKGKGTCTHFLAMFLEELGYKTGHTTSPQIIDERDRFYINNQKTTWEQLLPIIEEVLTVVEKNKITPTIFDIFTAIALLLFKKNNIQIAILETGLGGRWDSTNCLNASQTLGSLITLIDYDHTDKLGHTLELIAGEKAGIIKAGIPVYYLKQSQAVNQVIENKAKELSSMHQAIELHPWFTSSNKLFPTFIPPSIKANLSLVMGLLQQQGYPLKEEHLHTVISKLPITGRYHRIKNILIDGAHTPSSMQHLIDCIKTDPQLKKYHKINFFFYSLFDKDIAGLIKIIPDKWNLFFFDCQLHYVSSTNVKHIKKIIDQTRQVEVETIKSFNKINWQHSPEELFVFTGSFRLVGYVLNQLIKQGIFLD